MEISLLCIPTNGNLSCHIFVCPLHDVMAFSNCLSIQRHPSSCVISKSFTNTNLLRYVIMPIDFWGLDIDFQFQSFRAINLKLGTTLVYGQVRFLFLEYSVSWGDVCNLSEKKNSFCRCQSCALFSDFAQVHKNNQENSWLSICAHQICELVILRLEML